MSEQMDQGQRDIEDRKLVTPHELREMGAVAEINRLLLHPIGLALGVSYADDDAAGQHVPSRPGLS